MNAYDFDDTIYDGDTSVDLVLYTLREKPFLMIKYIFKTIPIGIKYLFKKVRVKELKERLFTFIIKIENSDEYLDKFVESHMKNIKSWYYEIQKKDDVIISASYSMWIKKFCNKLDIKNVIATEVNLNTGKIIGNNCSRKEKLIRFDKEYPNKKINKAYSDSPKDIPLLERAEEGFVVKGNKINSYRKGYKF